MDFPNLKKEIPIKVKETWRIQKKTGLEKKFPTIFNNQNTKHTKQRKISKDASEKDELT